MISLERVPDTRLYQPPPPERGYVVFLLWAGSAPAKLTVDETWSDIGPPDLIGWYVFSNAAPVDAAFEERLRSQLSAPERTSFTWVPAEGKPVATIPVVADRDGAPMVGADVLVGLPPGFTGIGFAAGAPTRARVDDTGSVIGLELGYPPSAAPSPHVSAGVGIPLATASAGTIEFYGFVNANEAGKDLTVVKSLVFVQIDPVRPFAPDRTYTRLTGREYAFAGGPGAYRLVPAEGDDR